jgi:hypothetical protein
MTPFFSRPVLSSAVYSKAPMIQEKPAIRLAENTIRFGGRHCGI